VSFEEIVNLAVKTVQAAEAEGIILRIIGAVAINIHCPTFNKIQKLLGRELSDVDFVSYSRYRDKIAPLFKNLGYRYEELLSKIYTIEFGHLPRMIFEKNNLKVEVFFDVLEFNHAIPIKGRLELDSPTLSLADLSLLKLQIVKINEKDVIDLMTLFREHEVGDKDEKEIINAKYIAKLCAKDWGLWKTVTDNLRLIKGMVDKYEKLSNEDRANVKEKIDKILDFIDREPKTMGWKLRAKIGTKKKWYKEVEEISR